MGKPLQIRLTRGKVTLIDLCDADLAAELWHAHPGPDGTYTARRTKYAPKGHRTRLIRFVMHQLILERMLGRPLRPGEVVDHINHDTLDNRRTNLRLATPQQNSWNRVPHRGSTSRYLGVSFDRAKNGGRWRAQIRVNGHRIHLGWFKDESEAAQAYNRAAAEHFGEFANLNPGPQGGTPGGNRAC